MKKPEGQKRDALAQYYPTPAMNSESLDTVILLRSTNGGMADHGAGRRPKGRVKSGFYENAGTRIILLSSNLLSRGPSPCFHHLPIRPAIP